MSSTGTSLPKVCYGKARSAYDDDDREAFEAGRRIAAGSRDRADFLAIFEWKTRGRGRSRPVRNTDVEVAHALDLAIAARSDRAAVAVLTGLAGVDVPVASAILTTVDPERFTIVDFRALWSLGIERMTYCSVAFYLEYLAACRRIAADAGTDLRTLDRALWQYSRENQPPVNRSQAGVTRSRTTRPSDSLRAKRLSQK